MVAIVGYKGLLGSSLYDSFKSSDLIGIDKNNYHEHIGKSFDVLINANGNSKKYLAENKPLLDFDLSVLSVYNTLKDFKIKKYIYISSIDVFKHNVYGQHKLIAESLVRNNFSDYLILRCPMIIGNNMQKGIIFDILNNKKIYTSKESKLQIILNTEISTIISYLTSYKGILNICPKSIKVSKIISILNKDVKINDNPKLELYNYKSDVLTRSSEFYIKKYYEIIKKY